MRVSQAKSSVKWCIVILFWFKDSHCNQSGRCGAPIPGGKKMRKTSIKLWGFVFIRSFFMPFTIRSVANNIFWNDLKVQSRFPETEEEQKLEIQVRQGAKVYRPVISILLVLILFRSPENKDHNPSDWKRSDARPCCEVKYKELNERSCWKLLTERWWEIVGDNKRSFIK